TGRELAIADDVRENALAYLVVMMENNHADRLDDDMQALAEQLAALGAIDVYVLPPQAAIQLIEAREKAFWVAKASGADDIVDIVVPRAAVAELMTKVADVASTHQSWIAGCGQAGDGNVHLSGFQPDSERRAKGPRALVEAAGALAAGRARARARSLTRAPPS